MSKSKARKQREHTIRNHGSDTAKLRGAAPDYSLHERKTMTKQEKWKKTYSKHKKRSLHGASDEGIAFLFSRRTGVKSWRILSFGPYLDEVGPYPGKPGPYSC
ncbi:hypothetical protein ACQCVE_12460 [Metabacillus sp. 113a]|uniref:hypothetical protein n=1 Tax=Metabacillus sp. 113a TaxID=3404706 RepID=UPI003CF58F41